MKFIIRAAGIEDKDQILSLIPRLADFDVPEHRNPDHVWLDIRSLFLEWLGGSKPKHWVSVAAVDDIVVGVVMTSQREEVLSHDPSVHLDMLVVAKSAQGYGIGRALLDAAEKQAIVDGAKSMSLFVFANNERARRLYEDVGFEGELIRCFKQL